MNRESAVYRICSCLETLIEGKKTDPSSAASDPTSKKDALFNDLKRNVHLAFEKIEKYEDIKVSVKQYVLPCYKNKCKTCDYLSFLELCLVLLKLANAALLAEETEQSASESKNTSVPKGLLSISQQKIVKKCLQFVAALGILPNLLRGLGIPLSKRSEYAKVLEHFASESTPHQKHVQLVICIDTLLNCLERDALQSIILSYHATDLLAGLFQLCHAPVKKCDCELYPDPQWPSELQERDFAAKLSLIKDNSPYSEHQMTNEMLDDRAYFTPKLEKFLKRVCPSLLMWDLLLFQGIPVKLDESDFTIAKAPLWLRKICSQMSTDLILQNHGVASFVQVVLDKAFDVDVQSGALDTVKMNAVACLISFNPVRHVTVEDYIQRLSKQVFELLHVKGTQSDKVMHYVASCIILQLCERDMKSAEQNFLDVLFKPLSLCVNRPTGDTNIVVNEKDLTSCIEDLHKIFITSSSPTSRKYMKLLPPYFHCLCYLHFFLMDGISYLKAKVKSLVVFVLNNTSTEEGVSLLHAITFYSNKCSSVCLTTVDFAYGEEGGVGAILKKKNENYSDLDENCRAILELLAELKNKNLNRSYLLLILKEFCAFQKDLNGGDDALKVRLLFSSLLQELTEWDVDIGEILMSNIAEVIDLLVVLLESVAGYVNDALCFGEETVLMVLMILNSLIEYDSKLTSEDWAALKKCLPSLQKLQGSEVISSYIDPVVFSILTNIATHGAPSKDGTYPVPVKDYLASNSKLLNQKSKPSAKEPLGTKQNRKENSDGLCKTPNQKQMEDTVNSKESSPAKLSKSVDYELCSDFAKCKISTKQNSDVNYKALTPFQRAMNDIQDSSIPVKGHGLISLGKLLKKKDPETLCNKTELLMIFQENVEDEDSYIYLSAIQGLSCLSDIDAELVLPAVLNKFKNPDEMKCEYILKMGEVLLKICRVLGELVCKYKDQLLHTYLVGCKHENPQIRSSSLSNLGEACMHLKFNIEGHWLQEILMCVQSLLKTDKDVEVRRCAVLVITLLLRGVGKDLFQILENDVKTIYTLLKIVYHTGNDNILRLHSQVALEEINNVMAEILTQQLPLVKEIRILQ